ncbi:PAS domain-containing protein [Methylobacterium trifolii]|uniref:PAS domain-containing protein n=1 Tax=Methylobacterium trifolii TaxID=1003092 RepID=UPI001EDFDFE2|nr:PAS domain-containing protein [Methylobacterium trifolii]
MNPSFQSALGASGYVGMWETDLNTQIVELSGTLPVLLKIDAERANEGVSVLEFLDGIHAEDRDRVADLVHKAHQSAGRFEAEFRTVGVSGQTHWISARGQVETDLRGRGLRCLGVALDISDTRRTGGSPEHNTAEVQEKLVDALIAVRPLAEKLDSPIVKTLLDLMLFELGKQILNQQRPGAFIERH